jgi:P27 family predicted phage terminase small subunit
LKKSPARRSPPKRLSTEAKGCWLDLVSEYAIADAGGLQILLSALEAFDRMRSAQKQIKTDGETYRDRFGQIRAHPLLPVERDARAQYLAGLRALNLDVEPLRDRPGRPGGR